VCLLDDRILYVYLLIVFCVFIGWLHSVTDEVMAVVKLDNQQMAQTSWKSHSQQCWDHRISIELDRVSTNSAGIIVLV
jgi:hypothetical protein